MNITETLADSYKVDVAKKYTKYEDFNLPTALAVRHQDGRVLMFLNDKRVDLNTIHAHRIGLDLGKVMLAPDEMSILIINGERVDLPDPLAHKLSAGLLRKADEADDWQLNQSNRRKL